MTYVLKTKGEDGNLTQCHDAVVAEYRELDRALKDAEVMRDAFGRPIYIVAQPLGCIVAFV